MLGDEGAYELRDVAALYLHAEDLPSAITHLDAYAKTVAARGRANFLLHLVQKFLCKALPLHKAHNNGHAGVISSVCDSGLTLSAATFCTPT